MALPSLPLLLLKLELLLEAAALQPLLSLSLT
jgi:hypothetical protein